MRYLPILLIIFISLCAGLPQLGELPLVEEPGVSVIDQGSPDLYFRVQAIPLEISAGRNVNLFFELRNKNSFDLNILKVEAYDTCIFDPENSQRIKNDIGILQPNRTLTWSWRWEAPSNIELDKDCEIKFLVEYEGEYYLAQDIVVLSESEYTTRELGDTLQDIPVQTSSSNTPLRISLTFSEKQPFLENTGYLMYIDYFNDGKGFITLNRNYPVKIKLPANIESLSCEDYTGAGELSLNKEDDLKFIRNKAPRTTCNFKIKVADRPMYIESLSITAKYKYVLDNSILVKAKRSSIIVGGPITTLCTRAKPTVSISPASKTGLAGSTLTYTVGIKNNDNAECGSSNFELTGTCPSSSGWACTLSKSSVTINPLSTDSSTIISVTSPVTAIPNMYTFKVKATNSGDTSYWDESSGSYEITTSPCTGTLSTSTSGAGTCTVTASMSASNCDGKTWQIRDDGNVKCSGTVSGDIYSYTCPDWTVTSGTYSYKLYVDGNLKDSKTVTCSIPPSVFEILLNPDNKNIVSGETASSTVSARTIPLTGPYRVDLELYSITTTSGKTDTNNFGITVRFEPRNYVTTDNWFPDTSTTTMKVETQSTTPADSYLITIKGTSYTAPPLERTKTFTLNIAP